MPFHEIARKYKVSREEPLPIDSNLHAADLAQEVDLATYEYKYPRSPFNKGVRTLDEEHLGQVLKETDDRIVV